MLQATSMANGSENKAFYSSDLGGIVTHPALMLVAIDDHMVHRGHAVFDTAHLTQVAIAYYAFKLHLLSIYHRIVLHMMCLRYQQSFNGIPCPSFGAASCT